MTYREMLTVQDVNYDWLYLVEEAETLLRHCWERFFADADVKPLSERDTEEVGLTLRMCCDHISAAILSYRLTVGEDGPGVEEYLRDAAQHQEARELNALVSAAHDMERKRPGVFREIDQLSLETGQRSA